MAIDIWQQCRKVRCLKSACPKLLAKDFQAHIFTAHNDAYGKLIDNIGMWTLTTFTGWGWWSRTGLG